MSCFPPQLRDLLIDVLDRIDEIDWSVDPPESVVIVPPHPVWTLFCLILYRERLEWAHGILSAQVGDPASTPNATGFVRGHSEWEYELEGQRGLLTSRVTGEFLVVDLLNGPHLVCDWAFARWAASFREPDAVIARLLELHPGGHSLPLTLRILSRLDLVHDLGDDEYILCEAARQYHPAVERLAEQWRLSHGRSEVAHVVGDVFVLPHEGGADHPRAAEVREHVRRGWVELILREVEQWGCLDKAAFLALRAASGEERYLERRSERQLALHELLVTGWRAREVSCAADWEACRPLAHHPVITYAYEHPLRQACSQPVDVAVRLLLSGASDAPVPGGALRYIPPEQATPELLSAAGNAVEQCLAALRTTDAPYALLVHVHGQERVQFHLGPGQTRESSLAGLAKFVSARVQSLDRW